MLIPTLGEIDFFVGCVIPPYLSLLIIVSLGHNSCTFIHMTPASFTYCRNDLILIYMSSEPVSISKVARVKLRELLLLYSPGLVCGIT